MGLRSRLYEALTGELDYFERESELPRTGRHAAVLMLFAAEEPDRGEPSLLITQRTQTVESHKGQMAFPGGMSEESDLPQTEAAGDEIAHRRIATALRETWEEVGIPPQIVQVHGALPELWTVSEFLVTPIVATANVPLSKIPLVASPLETAQAFWIPFSKLVSPETYSEEVREFRGSRYPMPVFNVGRSGEYKIWGATAAMIKNLLDRLRSLG